MSDEGKVGQGDPTLISLLNPKNWFSADSSVAAPVEEKAEAVVGREKVKVAGFSFRGFIKKHWPYFLVLTVLVVVVYFNSLGNGLVSDDKGLELEGDNLTKLSYIFSDPLTFIRSLIYALIYKTCGLAPECYRLLNVFFHLGNTYLVFIILSVLSGFTVALITASLFAVHPIMIEAITWISGGPYSQYSFFFLFSVLFYILGSKIRERSELMLIKKNKKYYYWSLAFWMLGLFSSNRVMTLFPIFYVYEFVYGDLRQNWKRLIPYTVIGLGWGVWYLFQIGGRVSTLESQFYLEKGIDNPLIQVPFAMTTYMQLFFWPDGLTFYHSDLALDYLRLAGKWLGFLAFAGLMIYGFLKQRAVFFWLSFFLISMLVTLTPFRIAWVVAERYAYLGAVGIFSVVAIWLTQLMARPKLRTPVYLLLGLLILGLGVRTIVRNTDWQNEKTLWTATVKTTPESPKAHNYVGVIAADEKDYAKAEQEFITAIKQKPNYGDAYHNLANLYQTLKKYDEAEQLYAQALKLNPGMWRSYQNLAGIAYDRGDYQKALEYMNKAVSLARPDSRLYNNLCLIYHKLGDAGKAKEAAVLGLKIAPNDARVKSCYEK